jgi:hypothetical protein
VIGDQLIRRTRPFLDASEETPVQDDVLLSGADDIEITFLTARDWTEDISGEVPPAVRLRFEHSFYGQMEHIFLTGGAE